MPENTVEQILTPEKWFEGTEYLVKFNTIKDHVKGLYKESEEKHPGMAFYTPHGIAHCQAVENIIFSLIPGQRYMKLTPKERYYLLGAAWLHDLGMERMVVDEVWKTEGRLKDSEIRKRHNSTSASFVTNHYTRCGVEDTDKELFAKLCLYHRRHEDINNCRETLRVKNASHKLRVLAAYLRLADALHVDRTRTPASDYAICLAYDISTESKFHWIKSRIVSGIDMNPKNSVISIDFTVPYETQLEAIAQSDWPQFKLDFIVKQIVDDLREELSSVMNILARENIAYYLDISLEKIPVHMDRQTIDDLLELIMNYDILVAPSASKLLEMILMTISNIAGYQLNKTGEQPEKLQQNSSDLNDRADKINKFIQMLENKILNKRSCHYGLDGLIENCSLLANTYLRDDPEKFINEINRLYIKHLEIRNSIRINSSEFFKKPMLSISNDKLSVDNKKTCNLLLYGFSELVIKAISGFRDRLIETNYGRGAYQRKLFYCSPIEKLVSKKIKIFVCEGQPKAQVGANGRLLYHDGFQYARALKKIGFNNIIITPDIVVDNIFKHNKIDYVLVGANGFDKKDFRHSAGHGSIINLAREVENNHGARRPEIILVTSSEKGLFSEDSRESSTTEPSDTVDISGGYRFWTGPDKVSVREHIWFLQDSSTPGNAKDEAVMFYNPKEDIIPIEHLDHIICDTGFYDISSEIERFISEIKSAKNDTDSVQAGNQPEPA